MQKRAARTSEGIEASDLIGRELRGIGEQLFEADGLGVAAVVEELVEELERRQQVILLDQEVHHAIAQRRSLHVHFSTTSLSCGDETRRRTSGESSVQSVLLDAVDEDFWFLRAIQRPTEGKE